MKRNRKLQAAVAGAVLALGGSAWATAAHASTDQEARLWSRTFEQGYGTMQSWYGVQSMSRTAATTHGGGHALDVQGQDFWGIEEQWPGQHAVTAGDAYRFTGWVKSPRTGHRT